jgi:DNA helicase II / ATP-dependent DNA helicase PcrA
LAGEEFRNLFAVADDDQILYQWNGASFKQIQSYLADFGASVLQLPTNYRCPPVIVDAANRLVAYNAQRTASKQPLLAAKTEFKFPVEQQLRVRTFRTDEDEAASIAEEIHARGESAWGGIAVLARTRALLEGMHKALRQQQIASAIGQRRDDFLSPHFRWLVAVLRQTVRPLDRRNIVALIESFNRLAGIAVGVDQIVTDAETIGRSYFGTWLEAVSEYALGEREARLVQIVAPLEGEPAGARNASDVLLGEFTKEIADSEGSDLVEDMAAWRELTRDIAAHIGRNVPVEQLLQELQLRSKEPSVKPNAVTLMTIHGAKGREFDIVYVIGLVEDVMPSFQSKQKGDRSPEMEEERRNCFVAITRTKECLILSHADRYRGWMKRPSRFLVEMGLAT